jgi:RNA polymerase sigma factor (sigma-70 family)
MAEMTGEGELLKASLNGRREAFGAVIERYQTLICAITYSATGDIGKSEELAQETFIRAWRNLRQLEDAARFCPWLCAIARNLASASIRDRSRDALDRAESLDKAEVIPAPALEPSQAAIDKERREMVWAAVQQIPQKYREPLVLFYRRQQSVSEVAADLDLSEPVVRQRLHRGRQLVKAQIASLVEDTLTRSGPSEAFTIGVIAALPALGTQTASAVVTGLVAKGAPAAKTLVAAGLSGTILGPILGLLGGILGAWCSVKNTHSPRERRFMIRMTIFVWLLLFALIGVPLTLALAGLIPKWVYWSCFAVFFTLLLPLIIWGNAHQRRIQIQDGTCRPPEYTPARLTRPGIYGSFGGSIFGATLWLLILAALARDWVAFVMIFVCDSLLFLLFLAATATILRNPKRYWLAAILTLCVMTAVTLAAVNLRWVAWMHAYRQSAAYKPTSDVSLLIINLIVLGLFVALCALTVAQYPWHKAARKGQTPNSRQ